MGKYADVCIEGVGMMILSEKTCCGVLLSTVVFNNVDIVASIVVLVIDVKL